MKDPFCWTRVCRPRWHPSENALPDFYFQQRALREWLASAHVTTAFAQVRRLAPSLPTGIQLGSPDFGSEWQSTLSDLACIGASHKTSAIRSLPPSSCSIQLCRSRGVVLTLQPIGYKSRWLSKKPLSAGNRLNCGIGVRSSEHFFYREAKVSTPGLTGYGA